jgi:hypothetical protein
VGEAAPRLADALGLELQAHASFLPVGRFEERPAALVVSVEDVCVDFPRWKFPERIIDEISSFLYDDNCTVATLNTATVTARTNITTSSNATKANAAHFHS